MNHQLLAQCLCAQIEQCVAPFIAAEKVQLAWYGRLVGALGGMPCPQTCCHLRPAFGTDCSSIHESQSLQSVLPAQIDGIHSQQDGAAERRQVMVLAATNFPWDIDEALRRRLEKRVYIPLPEPPSARSSSPSTCG